MKLLFIQEQLPKQLLSMFGNKLFKNIQRCVNG